MPAHSNPFDEFLHQKPVLPLLKQIDRLRSNAGIGNNLEQSIFFLEQLDGIVVIRRGIDKWSGLLHNNALSGLVVVRQIHSACARKGDRTVDSVARMQQHNGFRILANVPHRYHGCLPCRSSGIWKTLIRYLAAIWLFQDGNLFALHIERGVLAYAPITVEDDLTGIVAMVGKNVRSTHPRSSLTNLLDQFEKMTAVRRIDSDELARGAPRPALAIEQREERAIQGKLERYRIIFE